MSSRISAPALILLALIIAVYAAIGTLYAALTPTWQVPDEPAHYNYIRSLAESRRFPVLEARDYTQSYLERLTSERFPPDLSIAPLEYEDHQPPLYYLLATPIYVLFDGAVLPLRLFSVVLGAGLLIVAFGTVKTVFPNRPALGLMVAAFIAFIPQHMAMSAGVNNDTLAELIVGATLWALVAYVGSSAAQSPGQAQRSATDPREHRPWHVGLLLGAALLTKTTAYVVLGVAVAAVAIRWHRERRPWGWAAHQLAWMLVPALLLSAPWFVRNALTYGWTDPLGLARHDSIVAGQPRSLEWLTIYGWRGLLTRMARTTFQSFWGQFGWMAVPLPARFYRILLLFSVLLAVGFIIWLIGERRSRCTGSAIHRSQSIENDSKGTVESPLWAWIWRSRPSRSGPLASASLLALSAVLTVAAFVWYNLTFVQHQGRYLFPALIPIGTAAALGLDTWARILPRRLRGYAIGGVFLLMASFDVYCLLRIVVPNLTR